jgi:integrase
MARHKLTEKTCKALDQPGIYGDGDGLWLRVRPGGSKQFLFVYIDAGKRKEMGLGGYGSGTKPVSLALARQKAEAIREVRARGEDPKADRTKKVVTFKDMMDDTIAVKIKSFRNAKHRDQWSMTLSTYAADLHSKPIASITVDDVVRVLQPIWETIPETANRTRMRIASVINHAKARGLYKGDNPAVWRGALEHLLSERQTLSRGHHAALAFRDVPAMMTKIRQSSSVSASAVEFACLTAARSGEVRGAVWSELDLEGGLWIVPAERMKAGKEHRVPLTKRAVDILTTRLEARTGALVFEGGKEGAAISDTAMTKSLRAASPDKTATLHGLRSSFRDWAGDETGHARDVIEAALAHTLKDKTEAAYRRSDALEKRRVLMTEWESYCAQ